MSDSTIRVTVWNENVHEQNDEEVKAIYPDGMHNVIGGYLKEQPGFEVRTATLDEPEHGLTDEVLESTDVLTWWGHKAHGKVADEVVEKIHERVLAGMGLILLHSAQGSKIFKKVLGTSGRLKWREIGEKERLWVVEPGHPIAQGLDEYIEIEQEEMYGERFEIPAPDTIVLLGWFAGGNVMRSGCCFRRGLGKVFYFQPGHETYPVYHNQQVLKVIANAARWAAPVAGPKPAYGKQMPPLEDIM